MKRKEVTENNPKLTLPEVTRSVAQLWQKTPDHIKDVRAQGINSSLLCVCLRVRLSFSLSLDLSLSPSVCLALSVCLCASMRGLVCFLTNRIARGVCAMWQFYNLEARRLKEEFKVNFPHLAEEDARKRRESRARARSKRKGSTYSGSAATDSSLVQSVECSILNHGGGCGHLLPFCFFLGICCLPSPSHTHTHPSSLLHSFTLSLAHTLAHTHTHTYIHTRTHTHIHTHTYTHTHTHTHNCCHCRVVDW